MNVATGLMKEAAKPRLQLVLSTNSPAVVEGAFQRHGLVMVETTVVIGRMKSANVLKPKLATAINSPVPIVTAFGMLGSVMVKTTVVTGPTNETAQQEGQDFAHPTNSVATMELVFPVHGDAMEATTVVTFRMNSFA